MAAQAGSLKATGLPVAVSALRSPLCVGALTPGQQLHGKPQRTSQPPQRKAGMAGLTVPLMLLVLALFVRAPCAAASPAAGTTAPPPAPASFSVVFETDIGITGSTIITVDVNRSEAPLGADRFFALVNDGFCASVRLPPAFAELP
jgi:hypothetical protein